MDIPDAMSYAKTNLNPYCYFDLENINHFSNDTLHYLFNDLESIEIGNSYFDNISDIKSYIIYDIFRNSKGINRDLVALNKMKNSCQLNDIDKTKLTFFMVSEHT